jgi:hypothetical protein
MFPSSLEFSFIKLSFYEGEIVSVKLRARGSLIMKTKTKPKTREIKSKKCQPLAYTGVGWFFDFMDLPNIHETGKQSVLRKIWNHPIKLHVVISDFCTLLYPTDLAFVVPTLYIHNFHHANNGA